jgi:hypothetical protein
MEQGYTVRDRLLRPARVVVSKKPGQKIAETPSNLEDNDLGSQWGADPIDQ